MFCWDAQAEFHNSAKSFYRQQFSNVAVVHTHQTHTDYNWSPENSKMLLLEMSASWTAVEKHGVLGLPLGFFSPFLEEHVIDEEIFLHLVQDHNV